MVDPMEISMDTASDSPRGTKRKADDARFTAAQAPKRIKALNQDVVNKIAAGEIIVAPVHALKELIENAVDAGSTSLEILVKDGGLKLLQITDNGHGINKDDLPILCERFTTSKLKSFDDLTSIGTYGFRGEALASISHIAHLTITTRTADSSCAWRAHYADGKLAPAKPGQSSDPKPCAGRGGTQITVEDLFYNVPSRQKAFKSPSEEYAKILDIVGRYAVHCRGVAFSCKKHGESAIGISTPSNASTVDSIRQIHGSSVANELVEYSVSNDKLGFTASGWATNANYHVKKTMLFLFINHRSVESSAIKKAIEQTYSTFLPKGGRPFVYLRLDIDPQRVDVNVHPTKREVNFLNEDEIIEAICSTIRSQLSQVDTSRTFLTQSLLPGSTRNPLSTSKTASSNTKNSSAATPNHKPLPNNLIRTDSSLRKITSMLPPTIPSHPSETSISSAYTTSSRAPTTIRLATIKSLRAAVRDSIHSTLTATFATHTYVGLVDPHRRIAAIQAGVKLFLVDYGLLCTEYFYQLGLTDFANFGSIRFETPLDIRALIELGVKAESSEAQEKNGGDGGAQDIEWNKVAPMVTTRLIERREMLLEYFSMEISPVGELLSIPLLIKGYTPSMTKLPRFLMRLGPCVEWQDEEGCFRTFLQELATFYAVEKLPGFADSVGDERPDKENDAGRDVSMDEANADSGDDRIRKRIREVEFALEHVLFPAFRARLIATKGLLKGVVEVANLKGLYRVFERC
ncbi:DNA mismatch repair protein [Pseudocyphellaria aurata]|nr:DNA mismatch repair protein [Pseudocyphellaria aurata]